MMSRALRWGLVGTAIYALFLVLLMPASLVAQGLVAHIPGLTIAHSDGRALAGSFYHLRFHASEPALAPVELAALHWRFLPQDLLTLALGSALTLEGPQLALAGEVALSPGGVSLRQWRGELTLRRAFALVERPLPLNGRMELAMAELVLDQAAWPSALNGEVILRELRTTLGNPLAFGDYRLTLATAAVDGQEQPVLTGQLSDLGGPLQLAGRLTLDSQGRYRVKAEMTLRAGAEPRLEQLLSLVAKADARGVYRLQRSGRLPLRR